jgi:hypothetical protein
LFTNPKLLKVLGEIMTEFEKSRISKLPWWSALLTATCIFLAFVFHFRWTRPISRWPIDLPMRSYMFFDRPELKDFDSPEAQDHWSGMVNKVWWDTEWQDDKGGHFPRGIDVFRKCSITLSELLSSNIFVVSVLLKLYLHLQFP